MDTKKELKNLVLDTIKEIEELPRAKQEKRDEFFNDILSVVYYSTFENGKQVFNGCELLVAFGGPNIYIDTRYNLVSGYWGSDKFEMSYSDKDDLYSYFEEIFESSI
jgi:hypothetical protein